ncbi:GGDEF domain-containing protein [Methylobacterium iners]|uniref:diguanylate cyclase n=1 Tax=Methylobacterium iners TaxID=418707 RepID=A0ABQ4S199_9HYPH|nr:diguanylate cyclase [Methylobacterium iners]GJD96400.1 hypothetical protein OCOJLMKI_3621 [Methylobacterium iners]
MPPNDGHIISIEEVEREIAGRFRRLAFAPPVEAEFERISGTRRSRILIVTGIIAVLLYDVFLLVDWATLNDMFTTMIVARLGVFTPAVIAILWAADRYKPSIRAQEILAIHVGILAISLPMVAMIFSESPHRLNYQYGSLLIMMFSTIVQRVSFRYAAYGLACMLALQLGTTWISGAFDAETYLGIVMFFVTACLLIAVTTYLLEQGERRSFLFALRGKLLHDQVEALACTDPLTGLYNRRHLTKLTNTIWKAAEGEPRLVSAILFDIDHFKRFNDSCGHLAGDDCLNAVSACGAAAARAQGGAAFRFGGEEILVLLPGSDLATALKAAESLRAAIEAAAIPHPAVGGVVTASFGVASILAPGADVSALIAAADGALYAAKRAGRNRVASAPERPGFPGPAMEAEAA